MAQKSLDQIKWATPENPRGFWAYCDICGKDMRERRTRSRTCSPECKVIYQRKLWSIQYAEKMAKNPDFAKNRSALQYARIKANPEKWSEHVERKKEREQMPTYRESLRKGWRKYKRKNRENETSRMRKYRDEHPEIIAEIEDRRIAKRADERARLKVEEPEKYQALIESERLASQRRKSEKRLAELQTDLTKLVNDDE